MSTPSGRPERQSRARAGLGNDADAPGAGRTNTARAAAAPGRSGGPGTPNLPKLGPERAVDLDRLRASAASALSAEQAPAPSRERAAASPSAPRSTPGGPKHAAPKDPSGGLPGWLKVALPIGVVAALATVGVTVIGGGSDDTASPSATTEARAASGAAPSTSTAPSSSAGDTTAPSTAVPETTTTAAVATPPAGTADVPHHKATYRGGKLYLEGSITSDAEAQKYVEKAAAVLGPDNVVNNYVIDPTVPLSTDGTVYVDEPFLFETGSSDLNPQYTGVLGLGVAALKLNPAARMVVTGYTDSKGDPAKNQQLSLARANAVVDYMVTSGGIDRTRFDAIGAGDQNPVGDNNTAEGRALNRRIDVKLVNLLG